MRALGGLRTVREVRWLLVAASVALVSACGGSNALSRAAGGHRVHVLLHQQGLRVGAYNDGTRRPCFAYIGTRTGGGRCMTAVGKDGWAFELATADPGPASLLLVAARPETTTVRVPKASGGWLTVHPQSVAGVAGRVAVVETDTTALRLTGNLAEGYNAHGQLLGHTHDCAGLGGPADCGPYTGLLDEHMRRP